MLELGAPQAWRKRDIVANVNFFMNVPIDPAGNFTVVDGISHARRATSNLVAEMDVLCVCLELPADQQSVQRLLSDAGPGA